MLPLANDVILRINDVAPSVQMHPTHSALLQPPRKVAAKKQIQARRGHGFSWIYGLLLKILAILKRFFLIFTKKIWTNAEKYDILNIR